SEALAHLSRARGMLPHIVRGPGSVANLRHPWWRPCSAYVAGDPSRDGLSGVAPLSDRLGSRAVPLAIGRRALASALCAAASRARRARPRGERTSGKILEPLRMTGSGGAAPHAEGSEHPYEYPRGPPRAPEAKSRLAQK